MISRKRQAHEPLLPVRSAKQPRTQSQNVFHGGRPILQRWTDIAFDLFNLTRDTIVAPFDQAATNMQNGSLVGSSLKGSSNSAHFDQKRRSSIESKKPPSKKTEVKSTHPPHSTLVGKTTRHPQPPTEPFSPEKSPSLDASFRDESIVPSSPHYPPRYRKLFLTSKATEPHPPTSSRKLRKPNDTSTDVKPRKLFDGGLNGTVESLAPQLDKLDLGRDSLSRLSATPFSNADTQDRRLAKVEALVKRNAARASLHKRRHIYESVHKAAVRSRQRMIRKEILEKYRLKQVEGYRSTLTDFEGLLNYEHKLKQLEEEEAELKAEQDRAFLQRTLDKARATLQEPIPPKPFLPSFEQLQRAHRARDKDIEHRLRPSLPDSLPPEDEAEVTAILKKSGVISKYAREQVTDNDISRLRPAQWLNDEIINFYGAMLLGRSQSCKENPGVNGKSGQKKPLKAHYFSSFFWSTLTSKGYDAGRLAKWTKTFDIFSKDIILIPVNHNNAHWTAAAINFRQKRVESYDSMGMAKEVIFKHLRSYLDSEHRNKKKKPFDFSGWKNWAPEDTPRQENGYDCGVFTCRFLEALSRGEESFNFSQKDMSYLRRRMIWEIAHATLRDD